MVNVIGVAKPSRKIRYLFFTSALLYSAVFYIDGSQTKFAL